MLKFDFNTYIDSYINKDYYNELLNKKDLIISKLQESNMTGWLDIINEEEVIDIKKTAEYIKDNFDLMIVIGIGGSYLASYAFNNMFKNYFDDNHFEVIYAGTSLSSKYLDELLSYIHNKNVCINVISKSGNTLETTITYQVLKDFLKRKYSPEALKSRIIITTDKDNGPLRKEAEKEGYKSFIIPENIGGRYSFLTPAHLLPLALNYNIDLIINGYNRGKRLNDYAYLYACIRNTLFRSGKVVENFCVFEENMSSFTEWLKQLFGETEGKNRVGILPISTVYTRDLHSLGQYIQEGSPILFETFIKIEESKNYIQYNNKELHTINNIVEDSVIRAHYKGNVPCIEIVLQELDLETISSLIYFFHLSAAYSGFLMGVEPFNQPGVEVYKNEVRDSLNEQ